jgi:hypothetical protein
MGVTKRPHSPNDPIDFGVFRVWASLAVSIDDLPTSLRRSVFVQARDGLGYWDFVDLTTDLGRAVIGQSKDRTFQATIWCEETLVLGEIKTLCEGVFQTGVQVMNPETGEVL